MFIGTNMVIDIFVELACDERDIVVTISVRCICACVHVCFHPGLSEP